MNAEQSRNYSVSAFLILFVLFGLSVFYYYYPLLIYLNLSGTITDEIYKYLYQKEILPEFYLFQVIFLFAVFASSIMFYPKKSKTATYRGALTFTLTGLLLFLFCNYLYAQKTLGPIIISLCLYFTGAIVFIKGIMTFSKLFIHNKNVIDDPHNTENETFSQTEDKIENDYSVNIPTEYRYKKKTRKGWINLINLFRGLIVIGTPGSGKTFAIIEEIMFQLMCKLFTMVIYDFKFDTLSKITYNYLLIIREKYKNDPVKLSKLPSFYVLNFDVISKTNRANPIDPYLMKEQSDATNAATTIMLNLNKDWIKSQNFFAKSAISYVSGLTWFLKLMSEKYGKNICTLPHVIMLSTVNLDILLDVLVDNLEVRQLLIPFKEALEREAQEQLAGQTASAQISLSQMATKEIFYVMSESDFTLDINNPNKPKILCIGNNPNRKEIYAAPIGLYLNKILQVVNQKNKRPIGVVIDELPTIFINGLDDFIATARSNKAATVLGIQSIAQMIKDYGKEVSDVIYDICANIICGSGKGITADVISKIFGKIKQERESHTISKNDTTTNISMQLDNILPVSKIATMPQGTFAGAVADTYDQPIDQKLFHAKIIANLDLKKKQENVELPIIRDFSYPKYETDIIEKKKELLSISFQEKIITLDFEFSNYIDFYNAYIPEFSKKYYNKEIEQNLFIDNCQWLGIYEYLGIFKEFKSENLEESNLSDLLIKKVSEVIELIIKEKFLQIEQDRILSENYIRIIKDVDQLVKDEYFRINNEYPEFGIFDEEKLTDDLKESVQQLSEEEKIIMSFQEKLKQKQKENKYRNNIFESTPDSDNSQTTKESNAEEDIFTNSEVEDLPDEDEVFTFSEDDVDLLNDLE